MDKQNSTAVTANWPGRLPSIACPRPALAAGDVLRACAIAQGVVAIGFGREDARAPARAAAFARQIAMYLAHVGFGISMAEIGKAFGRDRTTVVHACHLIEDRRDEPRFDTLLDHLEQAATALRDANCINRHG